MAPHITVFTHFWCYTCRDEDIVLGISMRSLRDRAIRIIYTEPDIVGIIFIITILMSMKYPFVELNNQHINRLFLLFHYI